MPTLITPVALNDTSRDVCVLHQALGALGYSVDDKEVGQHQAGQSTIQQVRALQARLKVPVDEKTLVDETTADALNKLLKDRGFTAAKRSFTVSGTVRDSGGNVRTQQPLYAYDLDLRGAGVYRTVADLASIDQSGGFEFLGSASSDSQGNYSITFYEFQYSAAERKKADVVVYAVEDEAIIGRSSMVNSEDYSAEGQVRGLDVTVVVALKGTEYERLMGALNPFLEENQTSLGVIADSDDQMAFTAAELDLELRHLRIAAQALALTQSNGQTDLSHQLLYGIGRQRITLAWATLQTKSQAELRAAIAASVEASIIVQPDEKTLESFLNTLQERIVTSLLDDSGSDNPDSLTIMLSSALPQAEQRAAFLRAVTSFEGTDYARFWTEHLLAQPEFAGNPQLAKALQLTQQLTIVSGNHQALVGELQVKRAVSSIDDLMALDADGWREVIKAAGVPDSIEGADDAERVTRYATAVQTTLNAAFPTRRIARMVEEGKVAIKSAAVSDHIRTFLAGEAGFDFASSRVADFDAALQAIAGNEFSETRSELLKLQRVFQISATPDAMTGLITSGLGSAYSIASIPKTSFLERYAAALGGEAAALATYQRASFVSLRAEFIALRAAESVSAITPGYAMTTSGAEDAEAAIEAGIPDYSTLFGSPDLCECEHCRSVYGPAAYFVDLLRFLSSCSVNADGKTPLDVLLSRRPDLQHLPLTCENTNTLIPYIDLANEVMEYYAANAGLKNFVGHDTGDLTADELRAHPQNLLSAAYELLKDAKFPFSLPYHRPLDVIRTYSDVLGVRREDVMSAVNPLPDAPTRRAIEAETTGLTPESYLIVTGGAFDGTPDATPVRVYFGYEEALDEAALDGKLAPVREFLRRSGLAYTELIDLVSTRFINPYQATLTFLNALGTHAPISASEIYTRLAAIEAGTLKSGSDAALSAMLDAYNATAAEPVTPAQLDDWARAHLAEFRQVITLYEPNSACDLDSTYLRTMEWIYSGGAAVIPEAIWSRMHRFLRLWRTLGWSMHELDLLLTAIGADDITPEAISRLAVVCALRESSGRALDELAVLWGDIDTGGSAPLYRKLFLSRSVQDIDPVFEADVSGEYLAAPDETLDQHASAITAAFRITDEDLAAILGVAEVVHNGATRLLDRTDLLSLPGLSTIYRHVALAKALGASVSDLCALIALFDASPFSAWDMNAGAYTDVDLARTLEFFNLARSVKDLGFTPEMLQYVFQGSVPADSTLALDPAAIHATASAVRSSFAVIDQDHPDALDTTLTSEVLAAKLALTFTEDAVTKLIDVLVDEAVFEAMVDDKPGVVIPDELGARYSYAADTGRLQGTGVMSDDDRTALRALTGATPGFQSGVDELYAAPESFLQANFAGIFGDMPAAVAALLDRSAEVTPSKREAMLAYVYEHFVPVLKRKLREDAITQHLAALIGLDEDMTAILIGDHLDRLVDLLSVEGFNATYFSDVAWGTPVLARADATVAFSWGAGAPADGLPADGFSARWRAYLAAPAPGEYTLVLDRASPDDAVAIGLDGVTVPPISEAGTSSEFVVELSATELHEIGLDYAHKAGDAGVTLSWKTLTTALEVVPASLAYPADLVDGFATLVTQLHRAAQLIGGFDLSAGELAHFMACPGDFGDIDFEALTPAHWERIRDYVTLRTAVPQAQGYLTDVFAAANVAEPAPTVDELLEEVLLATAWDSTSLTWLARDYFGLAAPDFRNEIALARLMSAMKIVSSTGLSAQTIVAMGTAESDYSVLDGTAAALTNAVRAKYEEEDWLKLAATQNNAIRERQQSALVSYLLQCTEIREAGVEDADGLFEHLLIDVQMTASMDTSRLVQATAAVQMFVNRVLLNLESDTSDGTEAGVSPSAIDKERWEWMQYYRVWEANRKVFIYPENWLDPSWRNDRSEFFTELESYLVQNDITERTVEQAFRNYLTSLNEVANLQVWGMHREETAAGYKLHVFARTHSAPYKFFYRTWNEYRKWSTWQLVPVDIRGVEAGDYSGVHLSPVVWKGRMFLFWPEFSPVSKAPATSGTVEEVASTTSAASLAADEYWQIRLAWSEYVDGAWSAKQVTKEYCEHYASEFNEKDLILYSTISDEGKLTLEVRVKDPRSDYIEKRGVFTLSDIQSPIRASTGGDPIQDSGVPSDYTYFFNARTATAPLVLEGTEYLGSQTSHRLLPHGGLWTRDIELDAPFFFSDASRTYFVRPVTVNLLQSLRTPELYAPYLPALDTAVSELLAVDDEVSSETGLSLMSAPEVVVTIGRRASVAASRGRSEPVVTTGAALAPALASAPSAVRPVARRASAPNGVTSGGRSEPLVTGGGALAPSLAAAAAVGSPTAPRAAATNGAASEGLTQTLVSAGAPVNSSGAAAFAYQDATVESLLPTVTDSLEFHTFYHPWSHEYVARLNKLGVEGLLGCDTDATLDTDQGQLFDATYAPDTASGRVRRPDDFDDPTRTYYKENVCFDVYGANAPYNWELFFHAPLYIALRLSKNGKFEEAMQWFHHIFDPTTDEDPGAGTARYWKFLPFKSEEAERIEDWFRALANDELTDDEKSVIDEWLANPFDPHLIAASRPLAYMKYVVFKYVENLIAWADSKFRQYTRENVYESLQLYVIAKHILGPYPEFIPSRGEIKAETYASLAGKWDEFSNALVALENLFPFSSAVGTGTSSAGTSFLGIGSTLYFGIAPNEEMLKYWDTVNDRLYKIRHCQDIDGVERSLALFSPPISVEALVQAASQGLSLGDILADLSSPPPIHRFSYLIAKANELCSDVRAFGSTLLGTLEKKDAEELGRLRASHETMMLDLLTAVRERRVLEAKSSRESLLKGREAAEHRFKHYIGLLGVSETVPGAPSVSSSLSADSSLPADTTITTIQTNVDESLVDADEGGIKLIPKEQTDLDKRGLAKIMTAAAGAGETLAGVFALFPEVEGKVTPLGVGAGVWWGGQSLGAATSALARAAATAGGFLQEEAAVASITASHIRREQEWVHQANLAARDIVQIDKQVTSADIQIQIAEKELEQHEQSIAQAKEVEQFLEGKFTNQEMYQWMKEQLVAVYKQSYNLAYDMAKKAQKAYAYELGLESPNFIQYGYWDSSMQGLLAGEKLQMALRQLEKSYLESNRRELELTKAVSLALVNPLALIELRETGSCYLTLPEEIFDLDFAGHYFRRIKSVRLTIPCVTGPYTSVSCTLRLLNNAVRTSTSLGTGGYAHNNEDGIWIDDDRFRTSSVPVTCVATSSAQGAAGVFELNFRDERVLPFEGGGVISDWQIQLTEDAQLRQFDYATIADIVLEISYTAREDSGTFKAEAVTYLKEKYLTNAAALAEQPLVAMFALKDEFPTEWHRFLYPDTTGGEQVVSLTLGANRFPFFVRERRIVVEKIQVMARCSQTGDYKAILSYTDRDGDAAVSDEVTMSPIGFGGLHSFTISAGDAGLDPTEMDVASELTLKLRHNSASDYTALDPDLPEVEYAFLVLHYRVE